MKQLLLDTPYNTSENLNLAQNYLKTLPKTQDLLDLLRKIYRELDKFSIVVNQSGKEEIESLFWDDKERTLVYKIYQRDLLSGQNKLQTIVKKLRRFNHTYELRINSKFDFYRILFHFNNLNESSDYFIVLSYGFTKVDGNIDLTDSLACSNDKIKEDTIATMKSRESFVKWLSPSTLEKL